MALRFERVARAALVSLALVIAPLAGNAQPQPDDSPPPADHAADAQAPAEQTSKLYILNNDGPTLIPANEEITDNGQLVASLPRKTHKLITISAGAHEFRFKDFPMGPSVAKLSAEPGATYYLMVGYSPGKSWGFPFFGDPVTIKLISQKEAETLMKDSRLLE